MPGEAFTVTERQTGRVVLRTDDWTAAERLEIETRRAGRGLLDIRGTHPTHDFQNGVLLADEPEFMRADHRCSKCGAYDNGSYGSHAPCGFDFAGHSLVSMLRLLASPPPAPTPESDRQEDSDDK